MLAKLAEDRRKENANLVREVQRLQAKIGKAYAESGKRVSEMETELKVFIPFSSASFSSHDDVLTM